MVNPTAGGRRVEWVELLVEGGGAIIIISRLLALDMLTSTKLWEVVLQEYADVGKCSTVLTESQFLNFVFFIELAYDL